nr:hypothetical protein [Tanacetum cinerariifolium]
DSRRNDTTEPQRRTVPVETSTSNALVSQCDGVRSYDWNYQAEEEPSNYALMAFLSLSSSSDNEVPSCSKACSKAYAQLHSQYDKMTDDFHKSQFDVISYQTERDESWPRSSLYDRFQASDGYHVIPPPYIGTFMPRKPNLVFNTVLTAIETDHPAFTVQLSPTKPEQDLSHTNRPTTPIIEDWFSDSKDESETKALQIFPSFVQSFEQVKSPRHSVQHVETSIPAATPKQASPKSASSAEGIEKHALPVSAVVPQFKVTRPRHAKPIVTKTNSPIRRHITYSHSTKTSNSPPRVTAVKALVVSAAQDSLGKFEKKVDEGFLVRYSFNGSGPTWLFDIDSLTRTMNYQPVTAGNQTNPSAGFQDKFVAEKVGRKLTNNMCFFLDLSAVFEDCSDNSINEVNVAGNIFPTVSIGFMRPFGCLVTILNILDSLGKFEKKVDEGFLVRYTVNGSGPTWLFDIDSLTRTMNYQPVTAGNQTNPSACFEDKFVAEKVGEEIDQQYEPDFDAKKPNSEVNVSPSSSAQSRKQDDKTNKEAKGKKLEDINYSDDEDDVGGEGDFNNLETSITISPIPTTRVHKDHPIS